MKTMKTIPKILMLTILLSLVLLGNSYAQGGSMPAPAPVVLTEAQGEYPLGLHLELLEDQAKSWTIDDVTSPELAQQFRPSQVEVPNLGFIDSAYWVRFRVRNEAGPTDQWLLEQDYAVMHYMTLFLPQPGGPGYEVQQIGAALPFNIREVAYPTLVFKLPVTTGAEETIYLRFENGASMTLPLTIWSLEAFAQKSQAEQLAAGLLFGVMLIMIGYNLFIWFSLRDKSYLYYVLFVLGAVLFMVTFEGLAAQYLWPDLGQWNRFAQLVFIPIVLFGALKFTATFLDTKRQAPTWHKIINVLLLLWGVMFVEAFFFNHSFVLRQMSVMGIVSFLILAGTGFTVWLRGFRPARYFLLAWILWVIAVINFALTRLGLLPSNPLTEQGFQLGLVMIVLLLALALADRINILKQEREAAVSETLQQKDEFAVALQETNLALEQRVEERTSDLMKAKEQAEAASRAKSAFLANISHELRTPLNAILGYTRLMVHETDTSPGQQEKLAIMDRSGRHLLTLIDDVLEMARIEAGRVQLNRQSFDLFKLLADLEEMFHLLAAEKGLQLSFERTEQVPQFVYTDPRKLGQVLTNLLSNAIKFTEAGSVTLRVETLPPSGKEPASRNSPPRGEDSIASPPLGGSEGGHSRCLRFEVTDTGVGIAPEAMAQLFDPFFQTDVAPRSQTGTGLGLAIGRQFVQLLGGELGAASEGVPGRGSQFYFDIPVAVAEPVAVPAKTPDRRVIGLAPDQPLYRILVVEDNADSRGLLVRLLAPLGFEVQEAEDGRQAMQCWEAWQPDLIFMDMRMPVVDGYEATRRIRARTSESKPVIIAVTASAFEEERSTILAAGCNDYIRKPFHERDIFEAMQRHLGVRYIYAEEKVAPAPVPTAGEALTPADLATIPDDLLKQLEARAARGDVDEIAQIIREIHNLDQNLAAALTVLADDFAFYRIQALVQAAGSPDVREEPT